MPAPAPIPGTLRDRPFTVDEAAAAGLSRQCLRGERFQRVRRGVYAVAALIVTFPVRLHAGLLVMPRGALVSHTSAMELYRLTRPLGSEALEYSTNTTAIASSPQIVLHRRRGRLTRYVRMGLPVTGPDRTFVDCAGPLTFVQLVQLGDWLLHSGETTFEVLDAYVRDRHLDGVRRARRAMVLVRSGSESPRETLVRLMLVFARLPEPQCNSRIETEGGLFIARGDLVYLRWKVLVEYDGQQHETDPKQRQHDRERRERLEAQGWRVIVITAEDLREPKLVPWRVYAALKERGFEGPSPRLNDTWNQWFNKAHTM